MLRHHPSTLLVLLLLLSRSLSAAEPLPLITYQDMASSKDNVLVDAGPAKVNGAAKGAKLVQDAERGQVLLCDGPEQSAEIMAPVLKDKAWRALTVAAWVRFDRFPAKDGAGNVWNPNLEGWFIRRHGKLARYAPPCWQFRVGVHTDGRLRVHAGWSPAHWKAYGTYSRKERLARGKWQHVALTYKAGGKLRAWLNGKPVAARDFPFTLWYSDRPIILGGIKAKLALDDVAVFAAELDKEHLAALMQGKLPPVRAVTKADAAPSVYAVEMSLTRYDLPGGRHSFRQLAKRREGPHAFDWPRIWLDSGKELFTDGPRENFEVPRKFTKLYFRDRGKKSKDMGIEPSGHWFRAQPWRWGQHSVFTTDPTLWTQHGHELELWTFPLKIDAGDATAIKEVLLQQGGKTVYDRKWPDGLQSLTLQLPANLANGKYRLTVNGRGPLAFDIGLQPFKPGAPEEKPIRVDCTLPGEGKVVRVYTPQRPKEFPNTKDWEKDLAAMEKGEVPVLNPPDLKARHGLEKRLGIDAPRSPVTVQAVMMRHGMSFGFANGSHWRFEGSAEEYVEDLAAMKFDRIFEGLDRRFFEKDQWWQTFLSKCLASGIQVGFNPSELARSSWPVYSYNLPAWHAAGIRNAQLMLQRFACYPNVAGTVIGGESAAYKAYWMWAPPTPSRPWSRAMVHFHRHSPPRKVFSWKQKNQHYWNGWNLGRGSAREFYDYCEYYDRMYGQYAGLREAFAEIDPDFLFTLGAYGEGPGASSTGGWGSAGCIPARPLFSEVPVVMAYDWNEHQASKPLHNVALMDRLRAYYPNKPLWTVVDDFGYLFTRLPRERAWALALTRGPQAIGTNIVPHRTGRHAEHDHVLAAFDDYPDLGDWVRRYGGAYSMMQPKAKIAILYSMAQGRFRLIQKKKAISTKPEDLKAVRKEGSHEGKTTEALVLCTAAGWPAEIVTAKTLKAGLPQSVKVLLLTGMNKFDDTWIWHEGLEPALQAFVKRGGRILLDDESICPVPATKTKLSLAPYVPQGKPDKIGLLLERNKTNITELHKHMAGIAPPVCRSGNPAIWCIPSTAGDVEYVTVANYSWEEGKNASKEYTPAKARLTWNTTRPIYDVFAGKELTAATAADCDLTKRAFALYALPPAKPTAPAVTVTKQDDGFYYTAVAAGGDQRMRGIPVRLDITHADAAVTLYTATGLTAKLPLAAGDPDGDYTVKATELLSNQTSTTTFTVPRIVPAPPKPVRLVNPRGIGAFAKRRDLPLVIALTNAQAKDETTRKLATELQQFYANAGRQTTVETIKPNGLVLGERTGRSISRYPRWRTIKADLILLGLPQDNILIFDQARDRLITKDHLPPAPGAAAIVPTWSPFHAGQQVLNIVVDSPDGLQQAIRKLTLSPKTGEVK